MGTAFLIVAKRDDLLKGICLRALGWMIHPEEALLRLHVHPAGP